MSDTQLPDGALDSGGPTTAEPVVLSHIVTTLLYAAAGTGLVTISDRGIAWIVVGAAVVLSTIGNLAARARVSPTGRITWTEVLSAVEGAVYDELNRVAELTAPSSARAPVVAPAPAIPGVHPSAIEPITPPDTPVGSFTTSAAFAPNGDVADTTALPPIAR